MIGCSMRAVAQGFCVAFLLLLLPQANEAGHTRTPLATRDGPALHPVAERARALRRMTVGKAVQLLRHRSQGMPPEMLEFIQEELWRKRHRKRRRRMQVGARRTSHLRHGRFLHHSSAVKSSVQLHREHAHNSLHAHRTLVHEGRASTLRRLRRSANGARAIAKHLRQATGTPLDNCTNELNNMMFETKFKLEISCMKCDKDEKTLGHSLDSARTGGSVLDEQVAAARQQILAAQSDLEHTDSELPILDQERDDHEQTCKSQTEELKAQASIMGQDLDVMGKILAVTSCSEASGVEAAPISLNLVTTTPVPLDRCERYCKGHQSAWAVKCRWANKACSGCEKCMGVGEARCESWCEGHAKPWPNKCSWATQACSGCPACTGPRCESWCKFDKAPWATKCSWEHDACSACPKCPGANILIQRCTDRRSGRDVFSLEGNGALRTYASQLRSSSVRKTLQQTLSKLWQTTPGNGRRASRSISRTTIGSSFLEWRSRQTPYRKRGNKCSLKNNPSCPHIHDKLSEMQSDAEAKRDRVQQSLVKTDSDCKRTQGNFDAEIMQRERVKHEAEENLATATAEMNAVQEEGRLKNIERRNLMSELDESRKKCKADVKQLQDEFCALSKIRGELHALMPADGGDVHFQDCKVSGWTHEECSASCGGGTQTVTRTVIVSPVRGVKCPPLVMMQSCNEQECPIDCKMGDWGHWSSCSADCGGGVRQRVRTISQYSAFGGDPCGMNTDTEMCNPEPCDKDCELYDWTSWSACTKDCGGGLQFKKRRLKEAATSLGKCPKQKSKERLKYQRCNVDACNNGTTVPGSVQCESKLDVILLIDASGSIGVLGWDAMLKTSEAIAKRFVMGSDQVRMGVMTYAGPQTRGAYDRCLGIIDPNLGRKLTTPRTPVNAKESASDYPFPASNVLFENQRQIWASLPYSDSDSLTVDLGKDSTVNKVVLRTPVGTSINGNMASFGFKTVRLLHSKNGQTYTEAVFHRLGSCGENQEISLPGWPEGTRYVKVTMETRCPQARIGLANLDIWGIPEADIPGGPGSPEDCGLNWIQHLTDAGATSTSTSEQVIARAQWTQGATFVSGALALAEGEMLHAREDTPKAIVVLTDGRPMNKDRTGAIANRLNKKVRLMFVPVQLAAPLEDMARWVSAPVHENLIIVDGFETLKNETTVDTVVGNICPPTA